MVDAVSPTPVAVVAGAGAAGDGIGNGRATAILLAREGTKVVCVDRKHELGVATAAMIEAEGGSALAVGADVTDPHDCERVAAAAVEAFGGIDHLVNNVASVAEARSSTPIRRRGSGSCGSTSPPPTTSRGPCSPR